MELLIPVVLLAVVAAVWFSRSAEVEEELAAPAPEVPEPAQPDAPTFFLLIGTQLSVVGGEALTLDQQ